jgi:hypothetical protein
VRGYDGKHWAQSTGSYEHKTIQWLQEGEVPTTPAGIQAVSREPDDIPALLSPGEFWLEPQVQRQRSIFAPVFWGVLCALVAFTVLATGVFVILMDQAVGP